MSVPPSGYASPIYVDGNGRPIPVNNAGNYADQLSVTDALAQSPNTAFIKLEEFTGVPGRGGHGGAAGHEVAGDDAVRGPEHRAAHGSVDRRGDQGAEAGLVHPRGQPDERAGAVERRRHAGQQRQVVPAVADRVGHRPERAARRADRGFLRPGRGAGPGEHAADGAEQGRPARRHVGGGRRSGGLEPAGRGEDGHHAGAQVRGVRRDRAAAVRCGDHLRQLELAAAAVRRRGRAVPVPGAATSSAARPPPRPGTAR